MFAYEGGKGVKNSKNHAYVVYGRSLGKKNTEEAYVGIQKLRRQEEVGGWSVKCLQK